MRPNQNNQHFQGCPHMLNDDNDIQRAIQMSLMESDLNNRSSAPITPPSRNSVKLNDKINFSDNDSNFYKFDDDEYNRVIQESLLEHNSKHKEISFDDALEISKKENEINQQIRNEIHNKELLRSILHRLKGVDPSDPIFNEFFAE